MANVTGTGWSYHGLSISLHFSENNGGSVHYVLSCTDKTITSPLFPVSTLKCIDVRKLRAVNALLSLQNGSEEYGSGHKLQALDFILNILPGIDLQWIREEDERHKELKDAISVEVMLKRMKLTPEESKWLSKREYHCSLKVYVKNAQDEIKDEFFDLSGWDNKKMNSLIFFADEYNDFIRRNKQ